MHESSPRPLRAVLHDIDGVVAATDDRAAEVAARDLEDERRAAAERVEELHELEKQNPGIVDQRAAEIAKRTLLEIDAERLSRGGNPDTR